VRIGIPREIKPLEGRVALIPEACAELIRHGGHEVLIEHNAGVKSGYSDKAYIDAGVRVCADASELYNAAQIITKVKEPVDAEVGYLRPDHLLFSYLHLAANPLLAERLREIGLTAIAFETVQEGPYLPLLAPMSEIAGRLSVQVGTHLLHQPQGGSGILLGGLPTTERGRVVVVGAGVAGGAAAALAAAIGANVTVFDTRFEKLTQMRALGPNVTALHAFQQQIEMALLGADLVIGAVLLTGQRAPRVITREMIRSMKEDSVVVDISVDQGGCIETTRPTTYADPVYKEEGVLHFAVTNMPGAVPRTASQALSASLIPYLLRLGEANWIDDEALKAGINVRDGQFVHPVIRSELAHV
jgi:alanine dehydrogenase